MKSLMAEAITELVARAALAPRKRMNLNLHSDLSDPINRLLNAGLGGTYVRPHRHRIGRWELLCVIQGKLDVVIFSSEGKLIERFIMGPGTGVTEIPGGDWHSVI